jgi:hypothetical protein
LPLHKLERYTREGERELIRVMSTLVGCTSFLLEVPRSPFYRPKGPRSRWNPIWKAILAFCRVAHRTVRCTTGHPLFTVRCGSPSKLGAVNRCRLGAVGASDTIRCTPDSPVPPSDRWLGHASRADCAANCWPGRPLAHRTVR